MLLSLFCGAGGLDLGFEQAGYDIGLAVDKNPDSVASYKHNRAAGARAFCDDVRNLSPGRLDQLFGGEFNPQGVIGGPPCQSFSRSNHGAADDDPRHELPFSYIELLAALNARNPLHFFVMENVPGLCGSKHSERLEAIKQGFRNAGFSVVQCRINARDYQTPQNRERLFLVGLNTDLYPGVDWAPPAPSTISPEEVTVRSAIFGLQEPVYYSRTCDPDQFPVHRNHWCMQPKSAKFTRPGALVPGRSTTRSFKTLAWDQPSLTVAYGHREVHVHPDCQRRLSVYEAMLLQGFPHRYELIGNMSSQFRQVSEAVPPGMAQAVAESIRDLAA